MEDLGYIEDWRCMEELSIIGTPQFPSSFSENKIIIGFYAHHKRL